MRAIEKKRPPLMNRRRWIVLIVLLLISISLAIFFSYRAIHEGIWQEHAEMRQQIKQTNEFDMDSVQSLEKYVWEDVYWIMLAAKTDDDKLYYSVWTEDDMLAELPYSDAVEPDSMLAQFQQRKKNASKIKLQVGYVLGQLVWEVKYRDLATDHLKIAFYSLNNGNFIDEYTIPREARP